MNITTLAPLPPANRRLLAQLVGRPDATDDELLAAPEAQSIEWREVPRKAAILHRLAQEALELCEALAAGGFEFAGTAEEAARVVTATAYAAWRGHHGREEDETGDHDTAAVTGFVMGLDHARQHRDGMPAIYRDAFLAAVAGSADPVDRMPLAEVLTALWPECYAGGQIRSLRPDLAAAGSGEGAAEAGSWVDEGLGNVASIFEDVRRNPR
jgi:hypothetical protein